MGTKPSIAAVLRPVLPDVADEIIAAIRAELPPYDRAFEGPYEQVIRDGVERALRRFVDAIQDPGRADAVDRQVNVGLGRGEFRQGRGLDVLLAAYRLGARVAWRRFVAAGVEAGVSPDDLYALGEAVFAYIDGLSAEAAEGYAAEQSVQAGETQRLRRALIRALVSEPVDEEEVRAAADAAGWALPARVAALVTLEASERIAGRIGADVVAARLDGQTVAFVPDVHAPGRVAQVRLALGDHRGALGPEVGWRQASVSLARARLALDVVPETFVQAERHLTELLLAADHRLGTELADRVLAPLDQAPASTRARLSETLEAWLDHQGRVDAVAQALGVHPQTVRYRLGQLRDRLDGLEDPDRRFELAVALRARRLAERHTRSSAPTSTTTATSTTASSSPASTRLGEAAGV
jgi:PucR C-terminal helix-turn-helix domain